MNEPERPGGAHSLRSLLAARVDRGEVSFASPPFRVTRGAGFVGDCATICAAEDVPDFATQVRGLMRRCSTSRAALAVVRRVQSVSLLRHSLGCESPAQRPCGAPRSHSLPGWWSRGRSSSSPNAKQHPTHRRREPSRERTPLGPMTARQRSAASQRSRCAASDPRRRRRTRPKRCSVLGCRRARVTAGRRRTALIFARTAEALVPDRHAETESSTCSLNSDCSAHRSLGRAGR
jgi:hypothetical protein